MQPPEPSPVSPGTRMIRTVRADRAFAWYSDALRLFRMQPLGFALLAIAVTVAEVALTLVPLLGPPAANIVVPILACSLLFAALATDRGDKPHAAHLAAPFAAPARAVGTMIAATLIISGAEWVAGWQVAGVNLMSMEDVQSAPLSALIVVYVFSVLVSLPLTLVPLFAFFEGATLRESFGWSVNAFARNVSAFLLYGGLSLALLGIVFVTHGLATPIVLPLWAASAYAAWKDLCGLAS